VSESLSVDADGSLSLRPQARTYDFMWLPDHTGGTVSKLDVNSGKELARYRSVSPISCQEGERPDEDRGCTGSSGATAGTLYSPGRASVDIEGNVWIANTSGGFVTKIAATLEHCVDRNGDGEIQTSRTVENANNTLSLSMETNDECVLFSTQLCARVVTLAISRGKEGSAGDVWVVCHTQASNTDHMLYKLDASNGRAVLGPLSLGAIFSAEAMVDSKQILWLTHGTTAFQGIDTTLPREGMSQDERRRMFLGWDERTNSPALIRPPSGCTLFGIAADSQGRLWFAVPENRNVVACFYDPYAAENKWGRCSLPFNGNFNPRGIAFDVEDNVYMSGGTFSDPSVRDTRLTRFRWNNATGSCEFNPLVGTQNVVFVGSDQCPHTGGIGFDSEGNPWVTGYPTSRLNLKTRQIEPVKRAPLSDFVRFSPVHYFSLSDFTGYQMRNFIAPRGRYSQTLSGCALHASWQMLSWKATVPQGSKLQAYVRVSNSNNPDAWEQTALRYGPFETSPVDLSQLGVPQSSFLQLEFVFLPAADRQSFPSLHAYELTWVCKPELS